MRWRSGGSGNDRQSDSSPGSSGVGGHPAHDNNDKTPMMSSSMDDDEPDSSSQDPAHAEDGILKDPHGRLGSSGPDLPPSAGRLLENEKGLSLMEEEKKLSDDKDGGGGLGGHGRHGGSGGEGGGSYSHAHPQSSSSSSSAVPDDSPSGTGAMSSKADTVIEDDDGLDHSQPPDEGSDTHAPVTPWRPQNTQSTCEFTHTITSYSQKRESGCKKAEYSATTVDEFGNRWRLIVYVNGNGRASNHHLSLFLQVADADDLPFGWKKAVSYVLTLEHPGGANLSYAKRNPDKTFKLCPKAIDWGWSQFITSDRIQQEGFVSDDSLTVRASVTVKSSSVSIDSEDAELYLKCAVEEGGAEAVKLCLSQGASVNCKFKDDLYTPLHTACSSGTNGGSMEVLNLLLERGADGNACNKWRETPLLIAANNGHRAAVEALLKHGADPSLCSEAGWSALTFAAHKGYDDIVALLLRAGAPVNCRVTEDSSTPLHKACAGSKPGHLAAVKLLLDGGADVHALNKWRETPLLTAANHGQAGAVDALLKAGADPCKCTDTGWSPLSIAAYKGHDDVVRLLLEEGAPTEEADPTLSALLQAATKGLPDTVELLLRHGADHTVTTKKGDTALSILVEQNLIDAAVEMVTEYKASVPRCSRDRKKVQRARLLINLRMKQHQREGKILTVATDDDETDGDESEGANSAQHDEGSSPTAVTPRTRKKKKKRKSPKLSAEEQARAAEEALLLELEQEDAKAKKEEAEANSKRAKKRKKKERERQQKLKEEQERREKEEREAKEQQRLLKEKEEKERKEREQKMREQREREMREAAEREKVAAAKRRERDEKERRQREQEQKQRERDRIDKKAQNTGSPSGSISSEKRGKSAKVKGVKKQLPGNSGIDRSPGIDPNVHQKKPTVPVGQPITAVAATGRSVGHGKNRGWETTTRVQTPVKQTASRQTPVKQTPAKVSSRASSNDIPNPVVPTASSNAPSAESVPSTILSPRLSETHTGNHNTSNNFLSLEKPNSSNSGSGNSGVSTANTIASTGAFTSNSVSHDEIQAAPSSSTRERDGAYPRSNASTGVVDAPSAIHYSVGSVEHPAVALFRREKVTELLQRCRLALSVVDELTMKRVIYRWIVRSSHGHAPCMDCIIPSWVDFDELATYFQRQFISESRRGMNPSTTGTKMINMEKLREAGSSVAVLCHNHAKEVVQFRLRMEEQLPHDWSDAALGVSASDVMRNGGGLAVLVDWAGRSQICLPAAVFTMLRNRYVGPPNRLLTSIFAAKIRYETKRVIVGDTVMDFRLPPATQACLSMDAGVSVELWSDPFSVLSNNVFWGNFEDVDGPFGGLKPFGKDEGGGEELLARHGGSVSVLLPFDNMVATLYSRRMLDILETSDADRIPVSFTVFLHVDCFHDINGVPSVDDLHLLDPRLAERGSSYLRRVEPLCAGQHTYFCGEGQGIAKVSGTGSLFVLLQNEAARACFDISDRAVAKIIQSMSVSVPAPSERSLVTPIGFNGAPKEPPVTPQSGGYFESLPPVSPDPQRAVRPDFGAIGGTTITKAFSPPAETRSRGSRPGRLFDLVDDGEEDNLNNVDVVSDMLNNLNVDLFSQTNVSQDVDIEAISLMGIGAPAPPTARTTMPRGRSATNSTSGRFG